MKAQAGARHLDRVDRAVEALNQHLQATPTLEDFSCFAGVSPFHRYGSWLQESGYALREANGYNHYLQAPDLLPPVQWEMDNYRPVLPVR